LCDTLYAASKRFRDANNDLTVHGWFTVRVLVNMNAIHSVAARFQRSNGWENIFCMDVTALAFLSSMGLVESDGTREYQQHNRF
jgi:hypothetical protein